MKSRINIVSDDVLSITYADGIVALDDNSKYRPYKIELHRTNFISSVHVSSDEFFVIVHSTGIIDTVTHEMLCVSIDLDEGVYLTNTDGVVIKNYFDRRLSVTLAPGIRLIITRDF